MMFQLDQDCFSNTPKTSRPDHELHSKLKGRVNAYQANTIARGIISHYDTSHSPQYETNVAQPQVAASPAVHSTPKRKRRQKLGELAPLGQTISTVVFSSAPAHCSPEDQDLTSTLQQLSKTEAVEPPEQPFRLSANINKIIFHDDSSDEEQKEEEADVNGGEPTSIVKVFEQESQLCSQVKATLFFEQEDMPGDNFVSLPRNRIETAYSKSSDEEEGEKKEERQSEEEKEADGEVQEHQISTIYRTDSFCRGFKPSDIGKHVGDALQPNSRLQMVLNRNASGFNSFWPEFYLQFQSESTPMIAAKKVSSKPSATFILSSNPLNFTQNSKFYLGKLKSNVFGDVFNFFGVGLNPSAAKEKGCIPRELLATIRLTKIAFNQPREFEVFVKKPQYRYYLNFHQVTMYEEEVALSYLYSFPENKQKILHFRNRRPTLQQAGWKLDFRGRAERKSIKNFILEGSADERETVLFGKVNEDAFNIQISHPLSPLVGLAVALTTFDSRMLYQE